MEHDYAGAVVNLDILFLVNWMMDCLILLLVRAVLFQKVSVKKTAAGAFVQAVTYVVWLVFRGDMSECIAAFLAILLVALPLQWTFSIRKPRIFLKTVTAAAGFAFLLGGFGFFVRKELMKTGIIAAAGQGIFIGVMSFFALGLNVFLKKKRKWMQTAEKREDNIYEVEIQRKKGVIVLKGLYDSGSQSLEWKGDLCDFRRRRGKIDGYGGTGEDAFSFVPERVSLENHGTAAVVRFLPDRVFFGRDV